MSGAMPKRFFISWVPPRLTNTLKPFASMWAIQSF